MIAHVAWCVGLQKGRSRGMSSRMNGPLFGVRVVELGIWVAVPSAAAVLSDWGADVVKIEQPDGDPLRGLAATGLVPYQPDINPAFQLDNRGKRSIVLDLRVAAGREAAHRLIAHADVFVSNIRRQKLAALGMGYSTLRQLNPRLIYASLSGYGSVGPESDRAAFDYAAFWARSGIMASLGEPEGPPPTQRPGMGDHMVGLAMAGAIAAALYARKATGTGQEVQTSLFEAGLWMLASDIQAALTTGYCHTPGGRGAAPNPLFNFYRTSDGQWLHLVMLQPDRHWSAFCHALQRIDLIEDARFRDAVSRFQSCRELIRILDSVFARRTLAEWAATLDAAGCYWGRVQAVADVIDDSQAAAIEAFTPVELDGRPLHIVRSPIRFECTPAAVRAAAPELGQHTEEILLESGYGWDDIAALKETGALG